MTKKQGQPRVHTVWQGLLNPTSPLIRALAHQTVVDLEMESWPRFCAKLEYWQSHTAEHPITLGANDTKLFPLHRGRSRLVAGVLYQRAMPMHIWCNSLNPQPLIETVLTQARIKHTRRLPETEQIPIRGFESSIRELMHTYISRDWLLEALSPQSGPKKI